MLNIKSLKIKNYGGLSDREFELKNGLNVIYGKNESGKSTIRSFIHAMFYGLKNSTEKKDRNRYLPWQGGNMSGSVCIARDGKEIEIRRTFGKTAANDKFSVSDSISGEDIDGITAADAGEAILGVSENIFVKTAYIKQGAMVTEGSDEEITAKLINLASSGDEDVSAKSALNAIENAVRRLKAKNRTYSPGVIDNLNERKNALNEERYNALRLQKEIQVKKQELELLKERESGVADEIKRVEKLRSRTAEMAEVKDGEFLERLGGEIKRLKENPVVKNFEGFDEVQSDEIESLASRVDEPSDINGEKKKLSELEARNASLKSQKSFSPITAIGFCAAAVLVILGIILGGLFYILCGAGALIGILCAAYMFVERRKAQEGKREAENVQAEIDALKSKIDSEENEREMLRKRLDEKLSGLGVSDIAEYREKYREYIRLKSTIETNELNYKNILGDRNAEEIIARARELKSSLSGMEEEIARAPELMEKLTASRDELDKQIRKCNFEIENAPLSSISDIDCEIKTIDEELEMFGLRLKALETADEALGAAFEETRSSFGADLNREVNFQLQKITGGKYKEAKVSNDYKLKLLCEDGSLQEASALSAGTYEQIYLALRLGIAKMICGDNIVIIADDICAQYDDERAANVMECLKETSESVQTIMFTCHKRDADYAEKLGGINIIRI